MAGYDVNEWQLVPTTEAHRTAASEADEEAQWEALKEPIRTLYLIENRDLDAVRAAMDHEHGLVGSKYQFEKHFKKWGFRKNLTEHEWKAVGYRLRKRKRDGKDSEVYLDAMLLNAKKVRKAVSRYASASKDILAVASPKLPSDVQVCTPSAHLPEMNPPLAALEQQSPWTTVTDLVAAEKSTAFTTHLQISGNTQMFLLSHLPFMQFKLLLSTADTSPFSKVWSLGPNAREEFHGIQSSLVKQFGDDFHANMLHPMIKATAMEEVWSDDTMSTNQSTLPMAKIRNFALFMLSNKIAPAKSGLVQNVYSWIKTKYNSEIFSSPGLLDSPTIGALVEQLASIAIVNSDVHMLRDILDLGLHPSELRCHISDFSQRTPLQQACSLLCLDMVRLLLDRGADVNCFPKGTSSPLMNAITSDFDLHRPEDYIECIKMLLRAGANVKEPHNKPLIEASSRWEADVVKMLLLAGADPNGKDVCDDTPLYKAVAMLEDGIGTSSQAYQTVHFLIQAGACVNDQDDDYQDDGYDMLSCAVYDIRLLQLLLENGATATEEALMQASRSEDIEALNLMLQFNAKITPRVFKNIVEKLVNAEYYSISCTSDRNPDVIQLLFGVLESERKEESREFAIAAAICFGWLAYLRDLLSEKVVFRDRNALKKALETRAVHGDATVFREIFDHKSLYQAELALCSTSALCRAIERQHDEITDILLDAGTHVTIPHEGTGKSPLFYSIQQGSNKLIFRIMSIWTVRSDLLSQRLAVSCGELSSGCTASVLSAAVTRGDITLTRKLLKLHAEVNGLEPELGKPPLTIAVEGQNFEMIDLLIDAGADVNLPIARFLGLTALAAAVRNNHLVTVQYILRTGAEIDESSLVNAIGKQPIILRTLIMGALKIYKRLPKGFASRALLLAASNSDITSVKILLSNGVDPNTISRYDNVFWDKGLVTGFPDGPGRSLALITALRRDRRKNFDVVQAFLDAGADPNHPIGQDDYSTALEVAIDRNSTILVQMLITYGADVNMRRPGPAGRMPLLFAIQHGNMDVIEMLLDNGANVNAPRYYVNEDTALQYASTKGQLRVVRELLKRGADVDAGAAEGGGKTAVEGAAEHGRIDVLFELVNAGAQLIGSGNDQYLRARGRATENGHLALRRQLDILRDEQQAGFDAGITLPIWNELLLE